MSWLWTRDLTEMQRNHDQPLSSALMPHPESALEICVSMKSRSSVPEFGFFRRQEIGILSRCPDIGIFRHLNSGSEVYWKWDQRYTENGIRPTREHVFRTRSELGFRTRSDIGLFLRSEIRIPPVLSRKCDQDRVQMWSGSYVNVIRIVCKCDQHKMLITSAWQNAEHDLPNSAVSFSDSKELDWWYFLTETVFAYPVC